MAARVYTFSVPSLGAIAGRVNAYAGTQSLAQGMGVLSAVGGVVGAVSGFCHAMSHNAAISSYDEHRWDKEVSPLRMMAIHGSRGILIGATAPLSLPVLVPYFAFWAPPK